MSFKALDGTGQEIEFSTTEDADGAQVGSSCITDPITGTKQQVGTQYSGDGATFTGGSSLETAIGIDFNGVTFDRRRNNIDIQSSLVTVSGTTAQTVNGNAQVNYNNKGAQFGINITQLSASTTVTVAIQGQDVASGQWYTIATSATLNAVGFSTMTVYPGITPATNVAWSNILPRTFRVTATIAGPGTATATVGASLIL